MSAQYPLTRPTGRGKYRGGRPCFICGSIYHCMHREPGVDRAELWMPPVDLAELAAVVLAIAKEEKA